MVTREYPFLYLTWLTTLVRCSGHRISLGNTKLDLSKGLTKMTSVGRNYCSMTASISRVFHIFSLIRLPVIN